MKEIIKKVCLGAVAGFCALVAGCAFLLSYTNLREVAEKAGISSDLSPLWPICLDSLLVVSSVAILYNNLSRKGSLRLWGVFIAFSLGSLWFNVSNSPDNLLIQEVHAVPPIALCVAIETLTYMLRSKLDEEESFSHSIKEAPISEDSPLMNEIYEDSPSPAPIMGEKDLVLDYFSRNPQTTYKQAGEDLEIPPPFVSMRVQKLVEEGLLAKEVIISRRGRKPKKIKTEIIPQRNISNFMVLFE